MADNTKTQKLDQVLGRALRDKDFRQKLIDHPHTVAAESGLTEEELQLISGGLTLGTTLASSNLSSRFNPGQVAFCTSRICNEGSASNLGIKRGGGPIEGGG